MTLRTFALLLALALYTNVCSANKADDILKQLHYSMVLTGSIDIDREGRVASHRLDQDATKLPAAVVQWVEQAVAAWRFAPHVENGHAKPVRAPMRLRIVVEPVGTGETLAVRVVGAQFGELPPEQRVTFQKTPSKWSVAYPREADRRQVPGTVHLAIQVGRQGKPIQVMAEQVNLAQIDEPHEMERRRQMLANAAIRIAQGWRFVPPSQGAMAAASDWTVRIPLQFLKHGRNAAKPGEWELYIPGPKQRIPWKARNTEPVRGAGATAAGEIDTLGSGLRLITPLEGE